MYPVTKFISGLTICFLTSVSCYANNKQNISYDFVENNWYVAKTYYKRILDISIKAQINEVACEQKLNHCDQTMRSSRYYPKALADAKARVNAAESKLYEKMALEFNAKNADVQKD